MLELILKLYTMAMAGDVRSPLPHIVGPPGCGKSTVIEQAAAVIGVNLHIINVSRLSPLEVEGVMMPHGSAEEMLLKMLPATYWTSLQEGDILLLDEWLRGFPEVYNGMLDILTARRVGNYVLPKVFIIAASNSTTAYDAALEDRMLHIKVPDPRNDKKEFKRLAEMFVDEVGLLPTMVTSQEMQHLLRSQVLPMFNLLDKFDGGGTSGNTTLKGKSLRNLIGQAKLRLIQCVELDEVLRMNNLNACNAGKYQYVVLPDGKNVPAQYLSNMNKINESKLTPKQKLNLELNRQLIQLEDIRRQKEEAKADDSDLDDLLLG